MNMLPERVKIEIEEEINGFDKTLKRLLKSFESIESEGRQISKQYLETRSNSINPEFDDPLSAYEDAYFEQLNYVSTEFNLKQEFLNSCSVWLFHLFEKQKIRIYKTYKTEDLKPILKKNNYDLDNCNNWKILNEELRHAANTIKHGKGSEAAKKLKKLNTKLINNGKVCIKEEDIQKYISCLTNFWLLALKNKVSLLPKI